MTGGSPRFSRWAPLLIVGLAFGDLACNKGVDSSHPPFPKGTSVIVVGPNPDQLTIPKLGLSKNNADVTFWVAKKKSDKLYIEFDKQVFADMQPQPNGRYRVECPDSRWCFSREIVVAPGTEEYKYWQVLVGPDGASREADGRIIIDP